MSVQQIFPCVMFYIVLFFYLVVCCSLFFLFFLFFFFVGAVIFVGAMVGAVLLLVCACNGVCTGVIFVHAYLCVSSLSLICTYALSLYPCVYVHDLCD